MLTVWMDAWQMQCCGEPFRVGSRVTWNLEADADPDFVRAVLGAELGSSVTHWEERHRGPSNDPPGTTGIVRSIRAVRCRYGADPARSDAPLYPVEGSATLAPVDSADGWEPDEGDIQFVAYLIELDATNQHPPRPRDRRRRIRLGKRNA